MPLVDTRFSPARRALSESRLARAIRAAFNTMPGWGPIHTAHHQNDQPEAELTEAWWDGVTNWDRPQFFWQSGDRWGYDPGVVVSGIDPKPTLEQIVAAWRLWQLNERVELHERGGTSGAGWVSNYITRTKEWIVAQPIQNLLNAQGVNHGSGLEHMPALIYEAHRSQGAGSPSPMSVLRTSNDGTVEIWTEAERHEVLSALAHRTNLAESARNAIYKRVKVKADIFLNESAVESVRQTALDEVIAALQRDALDIAMAAEMKRLVNVDLPTDVDRARAVLMERLEDVATGHMKKIVGAESQQGMDTPASCPDQATALVAVSKQMQLGRIELENLDIVRKMQATFDKAKQAIEAVKALRSPVWHDPDGNAITRESYSHTLTTGTGSGMIILDAKPSDVMLDTGNCSIPKVVLEGEGSYTVKAHPSDTRSRRIEISVQSGTVTVKMTARNVCGPSPMTVTLKGLAT